MAFQALLISAPLITTYGWESVFLLAGGMTIIMIPIVYFFMPESIQFLSHIVSRRIDQIER